MSDLQRSLALPCQLDALLEFLHGFFERQVARLKFVDQRFEVSDGFFEIYVLLRHGRTVVYSIDLSSARG